MSHSLPTFFPKQLAMIQTVFIVEFNIKRNTRILVVLKQQGESANYGRFQGITAAYRIWACIRALT